MKTPRKKPRRPGGPSKGPRRNAGPRLPRPDDAPDTARLRVRALDRNRYVFLEPITALDRKEDIEEVREMIAAGEFEIARDELLYLVSDCRAFLEAHNLLGELALEEDDIPLAQGHFGFAYEIGMDSLPPGFSGRLPAGKEYNGAFFLAGRGVARCLIARGQVDKGREVLERLAKFDPQETAVQDLLEELQARQASPSQG